jgi:hypothetical protein
MNPTSKRLTSHFAGPNKVWIVEKGKETEAGLFQEAILELERQSAEITALEAKLSSANKEIDNGLKDRTKKLDKLINEWIENNQKYVNYITVVRNAAKGLVTQIDKLKEDEK